MPFWVGHYLCNLEKLHTLGLALNYGVSSGIGWFLAILAIAAIREKIRYSNVPATIKRAWYYIYYYRINGHWFYEFWWYAYWW